MIRVDRSIVLQVVNFVALVFLLFRFLFKPVVKALDRRSQLIKGELQKIAEEKETLEKMKQSLLEEKKNLKEEYVRTIDQARLEAAKIKEEIVREAFEEGEKIRKEYEKRAKKEVEKLFSTMKEEMVNVAEEVIKKFLQSQITPEIQTQIIANMFEEAMKQLEAVMEVGHGQRND